MEEQKISFETAKLAKEKGFYDFGFGYAYDVNGNQVNSTTKHAIYPKVTQSLLQKWLRDEHNLHIGIRLGHDTEKIWYDYSVKKIGFSLTHDELASSPEGIDTYEETLEIGLQKGLELI